MIYLKYFAKYRECLQVAEEILDASPANVGDLKNLILARHASASKMLADPRCIIAVNQSVIQDDKFSLVSGDEVAFYPPVTGG